MDSERILILAEYIHNSNADYPLFDYNYSELSLYKYVHTFTIAIIQSQSMLSLRNSFLFIVIFNLLRPTCPPQPSPPAPLRSILRSLRHPQHISNHPYCPPTLALLPETAVHALY